ncbi:MAG: hypothetical protein JNM44_12020 [Chitinophagaceae bacterium]|nr:hypothetical protein [Chitinophagaceae bacterium]
MTKGFEMEEGLHRYEILRFGYSRYRRLSVLWSFVLFIPGFILFLYSVRDRKRYLMLRRQIIQHLHQNEGMDQEERSGIRHRLYAST